MKNMGIVKGSIESAIPFEICVDTVYLRFNIEPVPPQASIGDDMETVGEQYQYHEIQYDLREWLQVLTESVIDVNSFALNGKLAQELEAKTESPDAGGFMGFSGAYIGLPEQKPFTFATRFTPKKS